MLKGRELKSWRGPVRKRKAMLVVVVIMVVILKLQ